MRTAADYRAEAARCRAIAGGCLHRPTGDVLRELAAEFEAKAMRMEAAAAMALATTDRRRKAAI